MLHLNFTNICSVKDTKIVCVILVCLSRIRNSMSRNQRLTTQIDIQGRCYISSVFALLNNSLLVGFVFL